MEIGLQVLVSGILLGGVYALATIGLTLVFGVLRIVNFAHGEFLMVSMYAAFWLFNLLGVDPYVALLIVPVLMFGFGLLAERLVIRPTLTRPHMVQTFGTLGLSTLLVNLAQVLWSANYRSVETGLSQVKVSLGPVAMGLPRLLAFVLAMLISLALYLFLRLTYTGKAIQATAENVAAAKLMGINVNKIYALTFALGSAVTGAAGCLLMPIFYAYPRIGLDFVGVMFVVAVMGGLGSVPGAVIAGLIIGVVETTSGFFISPAFKQAIYFIAFILVLVIKPAGLLGTRGAETVGVVS
jgi:branched-chain amino acid transport system permease protein